MTHSEAASRVDLSKNVSMTLPTGKTLSFWVYLPRETPNCSITVTLESGSGGDSRKRVNSIIYSNGWYKGWNMIILTIDDLTGGELFDPANITKIMFSFNKPSNIPAFDVTISDLRVGRSFDPRIIIRFDDGLKGVYTNAYPILSAKKIPATVYTNTGYNESASTDTTYSSYYGEDLFRGDYLKGGILNDSGATQTNSSYATTPFIDVSGQSKILIVSGTRLAYYDANKNYIADSYREHSDNLPVSGRGITIPSEISGTAVKYMRISFLISAAASQEIHFGKTLAYSNVYCTKEELKTMYDDGIDIGNHSHTHLVFDSAPARYAYDPTDTDEQKRESVLWQIERAQKWLCENGFGRSARHFSVPGGKNTEWCQMALRDCGVLTSGNSDRGNNPPNCDLLNIKAQCVRGDFVKFREKTSADTGSEYSSYGEYTIQSGNTDYPAEEVGKTAVKMIPEQYKDSPSDAIAWLKDAVSHGKTISLMFHDISAGSDNLTEDEYNDHSDTHYQYTKSDFRKFINLLSGYDESGDNYVTANDLRKYTVGISEWYEGLHRDGRFEC